MHAWDVGLEGMDRYHLHLTKLITQFSIFIWLFSILVQLSLAGYSLHNLCYLNQGDISQNETEDSSRFEAWKVTSISISFSSICDFFNTTLFYSNIFFPYFIWFIFFFTLIFLQTCLSVLGIPSMDVVRVLAAILLLGNIQFVDGAGMEVDVKGGNGK